MWSTRADDGLTLQHHHPHSTYQRSPDSAKNGELSIFAERGFGYGSFSVPM